MTKLLIDISMSIPNTNPKPRCFMNRIEVSGTKLLDVHIKVARAYVYLHTNKEKLERQESIFAHCSEKKLLCFFLMRFSPFDFYLIYGSLVSKDAVDSALSFYAFGFEKRPSYDEQK